MVTCCTSVFTVKKSWSSQTAVLINKIRPGCSLYVLADNQSTALACLKEPFPSPWNIHGKAANSFILQMLSGCTTPFGNMDIGPSSAKQDISLGFRCLQTTSPTMTTQGMFKDRLNAFADYNLLLTSMTLLYRTEKSMYCISKSWTCTWSSEVFAICGSVQIQIATEDYAPSPSNGVKQHHTLFENHHTKASPCSSKHCVKTETIWSLPWTNSSQTRKHTSGSVTAKGAMNPARKRIWELLYLAFDILFTWNVKNMNIGTIKMVLNPWR